jgi:hypothetical protein
LRYHGSLTLNVPSPATGIRNSARSPYIQAPAQDIRA